MHRLRYALGRPTILGGVGLAVAYLGVWLVNRAVTIASAELDALANHPALAEPMYEPPAASGSVDVHPEKRRHCSVCGEPVYGGARSHQECITQGVPDTGTLERVREKLASLGDAA